MITLYNVGMLAWALLIVFGAWWFYRDGQRFAPTMMVFGSILILIGQAMDIYNRVVLHGA